MAKHLTLFFLFFAMLWPIQAAEVPLPLSGSPDPERVAVAAISAFLGTLSARGYDLRTQGVLIESLDGSVIYGDHNSAAPFNPASVIKIATSFAALSTFGPDHRFQTAYHANGPINRKTKTLQGDLVLSSDGDPTLSLPDLSKLTREVVRAGIHRVTGNLVISGPFTVGNLYQADRAAARAKTNLAKLGVRIGGKLVRVPQAVGTRLAHRLSEPLRAILLYQNAHSSNPIADRLGETLGGPDSIRHFLVNSVGIPSNEVYLSHASGLDYNRITPGGTVLLLRKMTYWLGFNGMLPEDILPIAGLDPGTLKSRLRFEETRGAVVAKTGTLPSTDGGVSTLAGVLYTRERGPVLFAIFNTRGSVTRYRQLQDRFIHSLSQELGGTDPVVNASSRRLNN